MPLAGHFGMLTHGTTSRSIRTLGGIAIVFVEDTGEENREPKRERWGRNTEKDGGRERERAHYGGERERKEGDTNGGVS